MSDQLLLADELLPMAANYSQHKTLAVVMPAKGAILTIYEQNSKGGVLIPMHDDVHQYDSDITLTTKVLNTMKSNRIDMKKVEVSIISNVQSFIDQLKNDLANPVKDSLPKYAPKTIHNEYGLVLRFNLLDGSHGLGRQIDQPSSYQQQYGISRQQEQENKTVEEQLPSAFQYH